MTTLEKLIAWVKKSLLSKWGSLEDCCTDACYMIWSRAEKCGLSLSHHIERVQGIVLLDGEEVDHEWLLVDGVAVDPTAEQFGFSGYDSEKYRGEVVSF